MVDGIQQHLRLQTARIEARKILPVDAVVRIGFRAELVCARLRDDADERLEVKPTLDEMILQRREQFGVGRRVGVANVILRLDEATLEKMFPVSVHQRLGKKRIVLPAHPIGELQPRVIVRRNLRDRIAQRGRTQLVAGFHIGRFGRAAFMKNHVLALNARWLAAHAAEECRETIIVILAPALEGMVVALRALHSHAEEKLCHVFDLILGILHALVPRDRRVAHDRAGGRQQFAGHLVIGLVGQQPVAHPRVKRKVCGNVAGRIASVFQ